MGNEQELYRNPRPDPVTNRTVETISTNMDDKTMHELYMWPFADAVHAGVASVSKFFTPCFYTLLAHYRLLTIQSSTYSVCLPAAQQ